MAPFAKANAVSIVVRHFFALRMFYPLMFYRMAFGGSVASPRVLA